ncbi:sentrin-specific protease 8-like [Dendronephthya gigantea]|uniref:sentrin-specific protease 8-like n=1 Tax=Dendronephthya gigantea TaxID=151771 RepID=UPI00106A727E|nr:sentrin-specific protease 8-like [Dendronephthya gigantea]
MTDQIVLNFQDSLLRESDVKLLEDGHWLNDKIIGFMFEYFEYIVFNSLEDVLFVNPDVAQYTKLCQGAELAIFLEPLGMHRKKTIFIPVNSNSNPEGVGGTHWSLLVYDADEIKFKHYDSCLSSNHPHAVQLSNAIQPFLRVQQRVKFVEEMTPQQINSYDCGVYVISITQVLCKQRQDKFSLGQVLSTHVNADSVRKKRNEIKNIIKDLSKTNP